MLDAIWLGGSGDRPVRVVAVLGYGTDLRKYVKIEGSETGVPIDELAFLDFAGNYTSGLDVFSDRKGNLHLTE